MLAGQAERAQFTGGLEAARLADWHIDLLLEANPKQVFFAYDTPDDLEPLRDAGKRLKAAGFRIRDPLRAYVLCGWPKDNLAAAEVRMRECADAGFLPMAMVYRGRDGMRGYEWMKWAKQWARPAITAGLVGLGKPAAPVPRTMGLF
jgi:hypothetical protein